MRFKKIKSFEGQHSFWYELRGLHRVAIADQSIVRRDGSFYPPDQADNGLLFVDFELINEKNYVLHRGTSPGDSQMPIWSLPVVDKDGNKFNTIIIKSEYVWFMSYFG